MSDNKMSTPKTNRRKGVHRLNQCQICEYTTADRSNFNRHFKLRHSNPNKLKIELAGVRGSLRRHKGRKESKDETIKAESTVLYEESCRKEEQLMKSLRNLRDEKREIEN
jgi:hypothetical protein